MGEIDFQTSADTCLAGGNGFEQSEVSESEARRICSENPGVVMGYCWKDDDPECCYVKKPGTTKFPSEGWTTVIAYVDMNNLPTEDLFEDEYVDGCFAEEAGGWMRPGRGEGLLDDQPVCLFQEIHPCDLHQGALGDCWLISAIAALADYPDAIQKIFNTKTLEPDGRYSLNLYDFTQQKMVTIEVDDRLACENGGQVKYVSVTPDGEIWPCLLEKGMAAINGGFENINGYWAVYALAQMTGCLSVKIYMHSLDSDEWSVSAPTFSGNITEDDKDPMEWNGQDDPIDDATMWDTICDCDAKEYVMVCDSFGESDGSLDDAGVVGCHAYAVLQAKADVAGSGFNLLQIRNPWATQEASLPWSDDDEMWQLHPEVAEELQPESADDGMFWIQWEDFLQHYRAFFVLELGTTRRNPVATKKGRKGITNPHGAVRGTCHDGCVIS